jgi:periplasmic divalent cation tolerance protein
MRHIVVLTTVGTLDEATRMARALVERKLAACAHITPIDSVFTWKGAVRSAKEFRVLFKTTREQYGPVERVIRELHSYELPAIQAIAVEHVWEPYAEWIEANSRGA